MNPTPSSENRRWIVTCQDADDGTGDLIVPLRVKGLAFAGKSREGYVQEIPVP